MIDLRLAPTSRLSVRTRAAGVLARLAHDLELSAASLRGAAQVGADAWSAELHIPVADLRVAGTLHGDRLDPSGLSPSDRREVERRVREEVLAGTREVHVLAAGASREPAEVRIELATASASTTARLDVRERPGGGFDVSGACALSLRALGIREIKGPLGAFKLRDDVEIRFHLTLDPVT